MMVYFIRLYFSVIDGGGEIYMHEWAENIYHDIRNSRRARMRTGGVCNCHSATDSILRHAPRGVGSYAVAIARTQTS